MEKLKQYKYIILMVLVICGIMFYWFQLRPAEIRSNCADDTGDLYQQCLHNNGITE